MSQTMSFTLSLVRSRGVALVAAMLAAILASAPPSHAGMPKTPIGGIDTLLGLTPTNGPQDFTVQETACSVPANVVWPGETPTFTFQFTNKTASEIKTDGKIDLVQYGAKTDPADWFAVTAYKIADLPSIPISVDIPASGFVDVTVTAPIPAQFGAYLMAIDLGTHGRDFGAAFVRTPKALSERVIYPSYALDLRSNKEEEVQLFNRLGIKATRMEIGFVQKDSRDYDTRMAYYDTELKQCEAANVTVMLTVEQGNAPMPLGVGRPYLTADNHMTQAKADMAWLPSYDAEFQDWCKLIASKYGEPNGPVNAMELWNEPWEGASISGWGADMLRYREMYTSMAQGIVEARKDNNVKVLIGGTCSSMNTEDKLFGDGKDTFLKWLDFTSLHYQPMGAEPALVDTYVNRVSPYGPVRVWDTESWIANSEDRVGATLACMHAQGLTRTNGVDHDMVRQVENIRIRTATGVTPATIVQTFSTATGIAAAQQFMGERPFNQILFKNGLPWVFQFDGLSGKDDGTLVVVGDLASVVDHDTLLFRTVSGLSTLAHQKDIDALKAQIAALPPGTPKEQSGALKSQLSALTILHDASMTIPDGNGSFVLYDFYGNPVPSQNGKIVVPLNGLGYYLRTNGSRGSFARLIAAVTAGRIDGYTPIGIVAHDMMAPVGDATSALRLTLTNILNRPVTGSLSVKLGNVTLGGATQTLTFAPWETKELSLPVTGGTASGDNTYPLSVTFDAGADGRSAHNEDMHVDLIAHRTITVDGKLDDWKGVLPIIVRSTGEGPSLTEKAWLPFEKFDDATADGVSSVYLAYDDKNFYFAAKIADSTPYDGNVRFASRNDDDYFYPDTVYDDILDPKTKTLLKTNTLTWPDGVRHFTYRKRPDIPSGNNTDNVLIAFGCIPVGQNGWHANPPGTMPKFEVYKAVDYEYALNQVAPQYGGGTEMWRLMAPGMPFKDFYPRQPKDPDIDGGPVAGGQLAMNRDGNTRYVEAAVPWTEIPLVRKLVDAGQPLRFSCRIDDNKAPFYELAGQRSVSKKMTYAFHDPWAPGWANEVQFGWDK